MDVAERPDRLEDLLAAVRTARFAGVNITFPFKEAVIPLLDSVSDEATEIGAVNTVVIDKDGRTTGHNTDRSGFRSAFRETLGADCVRDKAVLLLPAAPARHGFRPDGPGRLFKSTTAIRRARKP
jgi:shikimate dehydrogenase